MKKPLLVLFDGNALVHRAFHALPPLTVRKTGEMVGAVYGFASILLKAINDLQPTYYAIAFDKAAPTFRHKMFDQYKATRPETPAELVGQFGRVRDLVQAFNMPIYELEGFEADDVLGTLGRQSSEQGVDTVIVTGDADTMQLVNDKVSVFYPRPRGSFSDADIFDEAAVVAKYEIKPENIVDYKALKGDPSDNIPGVKGVGEKTAVKLIQQFGNLEQIYARLDEITPPRLQTLLRENEAVARQSKELATIVTKAPVTLDLEQAQSSRFDRGKVADLFRELEFASLLNKLPPSTGEAQPLSAPVQVEEEPSVKRDYRIVNTASALEALAKRLSVAGSFAFDTETDGLNPIQAQLVGISVSPTPGESYYIPVGHAGLMQPPQLPLQQVVESLKPVFEDAGKPKIAQNGKFDMEVLRGVGINVTNLSFDTMIAAYLLCEPSLGLKSLAFALLKVEMTPISDLIGSGSKQIPMSQVEAEKAADYSCADADMTGRLSEILGKELRQQNLWQLFDEVEMPLVPVLLDMEMNGVKLDTGLLSRLSVELGEQVTMLEGEIYSRAGQKFNINSPSQLGTVLFEKMQMEAPKKKGGGYSTAADVLEGLRDVNPIIGYILEYRQLTKLKSTYVDALPGLVNPKTGRIHTSFNQTRTTTGRLSSSDPNLQNIPIRDEQGRRIREAFVTPEGSYLLGADYSQIDLRSLAHLSQDENLLNAFRRDEDIHSATAAQLYNVSPSQVNPQMRRLAKTVNFGVIYGMSEYGLQQATELSREEAGKFIAAYFEKYPGVKWYLELTKEQARKNGYVQTILGRKRLIPEINASNRQVREAAERMAINMPVQGTSADIIKKAMVDLHREMPRRGLKSKMLLQVHDELVFEVPENELDEMRRLVPDMMVNALKLSIPLKVDTKVGRNWGEMEK
ncbi:MAG: DNA polymerase I [Dehalococcoidales bacterium]|nr:DNA polymerase I [Dehalococcoidales bacterium]